MPLTTDAEWFDRAAQALYQAAARTRNSQGLMMMPPGRQDQCRAQVRAALTAMFNMPIRVSDEFEFHGIPSYSKDGTDE